MRTMHEVTGPSFVFKVTCAIVAGVVLAQVSGCASFGSTDAKPTATEAVAPIGEVRERAAEARRQGDTDLALRLYVEAADRDASDAESLYQIGSLYEERQDLARASRAYTRAIAIDGQHVGALSALGLLYFGDHQLDEAEPLLERAIAAAPSNWQAHNALGLIADSKALYDVAADHYAAAVAASPNNALILNNRGYSSYLAGAYADAERDFKAALAVDAGYERAWHNLGLLYARRGEYEQALATLRRVVSPFVAANDVGYIAMLSGDYARAQVLFEDAIRLSPRYYATANDNVAELRRRRSEHQQ